MLALQCPTTEGPTMADMTPHSPPGVLSAADVAELWTAEARKRHEQKVAEREQTNAQRLLRKLKLLPPVPPFQEIKARTVLDYLRESQQTRRAGGTQRRYANHPVPAPAGRFGLMPWWHNSQKTELIDWYRNRPGQGHGTGGWRAGRPRKKATQ
jgi:hypothetical protein